MMILRQKLIEELLKKLDGFLLTRHAFNCTFNNENGEILKFIYKDRPDFLFVIKQPMMGSEWVTTECPGVNFITEEKYAFRDFTSCQNRIRGWMNRIIEELTFQPDNSIDLLKELRKNLEKNADSLPDAEKPFDDNDAKDWSKKLDDIVKQIQKLAEENKIQRGQVNKIGIEFEELKKQVQLI